MKRIPTYLITAVALLFSIKYLTMGEPMPYHQQFMAMPVGEIPANVLTLLMYTLRIIGSYFLCVAIAGIILIHHHEKGTPWIKWLLFIMYSILFITLIIITLKVGTYAPWWIPALLMTLNIVNFFILYRDEKK